MTTPNPDPTGMPLDLLLVRHGQSEGNVALEAAKHGDTALTDDEHYRQRSAADYRLTAMGRSQAELAGTWILDWMARRQLANFDRMYCSPYVRTRETAALLGLSAAEWQLEPLLRERDWGLWEGMGKQATSDNFPISFAQKGRNRFLWRPECGESTPDLDLRVREMFATFARELAGGTVLCVTHEDVMWATRFRLEKMTIDEWTDSLESDADEIPNCGILHYTRRLADGDIAPKFARLRLVNPAAPETANDAWRPIERPRFSNAELLAQVDEIQPLWAGRYA